MKYDLVVTRHSGLVDYLVDEGIVDESVEVREHVDRQDVEGLDVIGVLPIHLAVATSSYTAVPLHYPPEYRGKELSAAEVREYAGDPVTYAIGCPSDPIEVGILSGDLKWEVVAPKGVRVAGKDTRGCCCLSAADDTKAQP